jgi:hypothetical protein
VKINLTNLPSTTRHPLEGSDLEKVKDLHNIGLPGNYIEVVVGKEAYSDPKHDGEGLSFVEWTICDEGVAVKATYCPRTGNVTVECGSDCKVKVVKTTIA